MSLHTLHPPPTPGARLLAPRPASSYPPFGAASGYTVSPTDPSGVAALVTMRPIVNSASSNAGGVLGGYPLTVFGVGFSNVPSENTVRGVARGGGGGEGGGVGGWGRLETRLRLRIHQSSSGVLMSAAHQGLRSRHCCVLSLQVLLDGVPCTVTASDLGAITCLPGPQPAGSATGKVW